MTALLDELADRAVAETAVIVPSMSVVRQRATKRQRRRKAVPAVGAVMVCALGVLVVQRTQNSGTTEVLTSATTSVPLAPPASVEVEPDLVASVVTAQAPIDVGSSRLWPGPDRRFESADELSEAFRIEVLGWPTQASTIDSTQSSGRAYHRFEFADRGLGLDGVSVLTDTGWGFVQLGRGPRIGKRIEPVGESVRSAMEVPAHPTAATYEAVVSFADGEVRRYPPQPGVEFDLEAPLESVGSAVTTVRAEDRSIVAVEGTQFSVLDTDPGLSLAPGLGVWPLGRSLPTLPAAADELLGVLGPSDWSYWFDGRGNVAFSNPLSPVEVQASAGFAGDGWAFVQVVSVAPGNVLLGMSVGPIGITLQPPEGTVTSDVELRLPDGSIDRHVVAGDFVPAPDGVDAYSIESVFAVHAGADGMVLGAAGGRFGIDPDTLPRAPEGTELPASQSREDAARDGVVPFLADLSYGERVNEIDKIRPGDVTRTVAPEGIWLISVPPSSTWEKLGICFPDDRPTYVDGRMGVDFVCQGYAEILLVSPDGEILRAYPFNLGAPWSLLLTDDAVYCVRQGDGGLPDSLVCRIDRTDFGRTVRVFPALDDFEPIYDGRAPFEGWIVEPPGLEAGYWDQLSEANGEMVATGWAGTAILDPDTLEIVSVQPNA